MIIPSPYNGKHPRISPRAFIAPTAVIIGDVIIEAGANIWFGAVLRGDGGSIHIGANTSIQDNVVLHSEVGTQNLIKDHCVVGHCAMVHGQCVIESNVMVGIKSVILQGTSVGENAWVGAGAVVTKPVAPATLVVGAPATMKKPLTKEAFDENRNNALFYVSMAQKYVKEGQQHPGLAPFLDDQL